MNSENNTIEKINEYVIKSVAKKMITLTSCSSMPFTRLNFSNSKTGRYGFNLEDNGKFISIRGTEKLTVYIANEESGYKQNFLISDITIDKLSTDSAAESYKKYCINTIITILKAWMETDKGEEPKLGEWHLYKF